MYSWIEVVTTIISSGVISSMLTFFVNRRTYKVKREKEVHDIYKVMYEDLKETILKDQDEKKKLYKAIASLERAMQRISTCKHYDSCPIRDELQEHQNSQDNNSGKKIRQPTSKNNSEHHVRPSAKQPSCAQAKQR